MIPRSILLLVLVTLAFVAPQVHGAGVTHFSVTQVRQLDVGAPAVRAYLDLTDSTGQPLESLPDSSLAATLGEWSTEPVNVVPFASVQQGVAYVFLVDISKSLSTDLFGRMIRGIETWVNGMRPLDRAAVIAFGESSQLIVDFTSDKEAILAGLESLGPTDLETLLHQALADSLDLARRLDPELPGRRALVVFTDGKDEGSSFEAEDILDRLRDDPTPIYAIGYSRLRDPAERRTYLNLLQRFASNSGGAFFEAEETRFVEAYNTIWQAIQRVWVADFLCADCRADGSLYRLQVQATIDGKVLASGGSVRLLPVMRTGGSEPQEVPREEIPDELEDIPQEEVPEPETRRRSGLSFNLGPWLIGLAILAAVIILWLIKSTSARNRRRAGSSAYYAQPMPPSGPIDPRSEPRVLDPPMPMPRPGEKPIRPAPRRESAPPPESVPEPPPPPPSRRPKGPPKQVRLVVVRGSRKGRQYSLVVDDRAVVGRRSDNDCILAEESAIDAVQFELIHEGGELFIENLSNRTPTMIGGLPLTTKHQLTSDTLVGTGETVLRIVFH